MGYPLINHLSCGVVISPAGEITVALPAHEADELIEPRFLDCIAIGEMLGAGNPELRALIDAHIESKSNGVPLQ
jgi:hypothetical protein